MEVPSHVKKSFYTKVDIQKHVEQYQLHGNLHRRKVYMKYETENLNSYQLFLYNKAMKGFNAYSKNELQVMPAKERKAIQIFFNKAQRVLTVFKQQKINEITNKFIGTCYPKSRVKHELFDTTFNYVNQNLEVSISFKMLGIGRDKIINHLIQEEILPSDFYQLKPKT